VLYSPALLLDGRFDASITDTFAFAEGCASGFEGYCDAVAVSGEGCQSWLEVCRFVVEVVTDAGSDFCGDVGYCLGWLSALALENCPLALRGSGLLTMLVLCCRGEERRG
jgi:hypothetical protein